VLADEFVDRRLTHHESHTTTKHTDRHTQCDRQTDRQTDRQMPDASEEAVNCTMSELTKDQRRHYCMVDW